MLSDGDGCLNQPALTKKKKKKFKTQGGQKKRLSNKLLKEPKAG